MDTEVAHICRQHSRAYRRYRSSGKAALADAWRIGRPAQRLSPRIGEVGSRDALAQTSGVKYWGRLGLCGSTYHDV
ncbi:hypothetical protein NDU88_006088 [Pleurodeles waltl]|uniref:Uncharacterized protein n=1 Tax=Pleurodeles waltl TaxID=8319 RepID=A0AAV7VLT2_PLEWA|nr:hypothetical protein NDU88_006088 [Pleurodeles waltl]